MSFKVNRNGNFAVENKTNVDHTCLRCDGCGIVNNKVCKACNGHGVINYDLQRKTVMEYAPTKEQLKAMKALGGTQ